MDAKIKAGSIVISLKGHDTGRVYYVAAVVSGDFLLLTDGRYRKLDNPKQKRIRHVRHIADAPLSEATDAAVRAHIKPFVITIAETTATD